VNTVLNLLFPKNAGNSLTTEELQFLKKNAAAWSKLPSTEISIAVNNCFLYEIDLQV
jgi:hypothetical protein